MSNSQKGCGKKTTIKKKLKKFIRSKTKANTNSNKTKPTRTIRPETFRDVASQVLSSNQAYATRKVSSLAGKFPVPGNSGAIQYANQATVTRPVSDPAQEQRQKLNELQVQYALELDRSNRKSSREDQLRQEDRRREDELFARNKTLEIAKEKASAELAFKRELAAVAEKREQRDFERAREATREKERIEDRAQAFQERQLSSNFTYQQKMIELQKLSTELTMNQTKFERDNAKEDRDYNRAVELAKQTRQDRLDEIAASAAIRKDEFERKVLESDRVFGREGERDVAKVTEATARRTAELEQSKSLRDIEKEKREAQLSHEKELFLIKSQILSAEKEADANRAQELNLQKARIEADHALARAKLDTESYRIRAEIQNRAADLDTNRSINTRVAEAQIDVAKQQQLQQQKQLAQQEAQRLEIQRQEQAQQLALAAESQRQEQARQQAAMQQQLANQQQLAQQRLAQQRAIEQQQQQAQQMPAAVVPTAAIPTPPPAPPTPLMIVDEEESASSLPPIPPSPPRLFLVNGPPKQDPPKASGRPALSAAAIEDGVDYFEMQKRERQRLGMSFAPKIKLDDPARLARLEASRLKKEEALRVKAAANETARLVAEAAANQKLIADIKTRKEEEIRNPTLSPRSRRLAAKQAAAAVNTTSSALTVQPAAAAQATSLVPFNESFSESAGGVRTLDQSYSHSRSMGAPKGQQATFYENKEEPVSKRLRESEDPNAAENDNEDMLGVGKRRKTSIDSEPDSEADVELDRGLSDKEIEQIMKRKVSEEATDSFRGVYSYDELDEIDDLPLDEPSSLVINLDRSTGPGTHWVSLWIDPRPKTRSIEYFDSFGEEPPKRLAEKIQQLAKNNFNDLPELLKFKTNGVKRQSVSSPNCGFFAIEFIGKRADGIPFNEATGYKQKTLVGEGEEKVRKVKHNFGFI